MMNSSYSDIHGLHKSSYSSIDGKECVAVGTLGDLVAVVDTKDDGVVPDAQRQVLTVAPGAFAAMICSVV